MKKWIWLSAVSFIALALWSVLQLGPGYFGKTFVETIDFEANHEGFKERLVVLELNPPVPDPEITFTAEQIMDFRQRGGSLAEQIREIQEAYATDIEEASSAGDDRLESALTEQREAEIEAVQALFRDDALVREQLQEEYESAIASTIRDLEREKPAFYREHSFYAYELTNIETGEMFTRGELERNPVYEETFTESRPLSSTREVNDFFDQPVRASGLTDAEFEGTIQISGTQLAASRYAADFQAFTFTKIMLYVLAGTAAAGIVLLLTKFPFRREWFTEMPYYATWQKWPLEGRMLAVLLPVLAFLLFMADQILQQLRWFMYGEAWLNAFQLLVSFGIACAIGSLGLLQIIWLVSMYRDGRSLKEDWRNSYVREWIRSTNVAFLRKPLGMQMLLLLVIVFFWGFGTMLVFAFPPAILVWIPAVLLIGLPAVLMMMKRFGYLSVLIGKTEAMAEGRLGEEIPVRGRSQLAGHAKHLNTLKEGVRHSLSEQAKSERLKTELITNVSHDLRTPLTSIITYTDLMKQPELAAEDRLAYADILEKKSQRLKTLIEDLFEVSKMASGNLELDSRRVDFTQLMAQAFAEHAEAIEESGLEFRITKPEKPVMIWADGQKWWRMLDNLILNAIKYALPETRVYVNLTEQAGKAVFVIKNITRYELGENTDELFERFKRGDTARHTDGSGLGLAIAQSIVDLHGGALDIEVDGDLFKVTVVLETVR